MNIKIVRIAKKSSYTIGHLYIDGVYFCDTLEDVDRGLKKTMTISQLNAIQVKGKTAIPEGTYSVTMTMQSPKFSQIKYTKTYGFCQGKLPRLLGVPAYDGVLIHVGNTAEDTDGCILVGQNKAVGRIINSTVTFRKLYDILAQAEAKKDNITITLS